MNRSKIWATSSFILIFVWIGLMITATPVISSAKDKPIELKFAVLESAQAARSKYGHDVWADMVNKGRLR
ncbi:MAG: hypothetical protein JRJ65_16120 [Deltaproteobacteria bacterium]|nr:hypothetical protein [Deltaproteobacteria bacterium]